MNAPLILIRGASGAGKSTFAKHLRRKLGQLAIFETDNFFLDQVDGKYCFDSSLLAAAHAWNQGEVIRYCRSYPDSPMAVANTMCQAWEVEAYLKIAAQFKRPVYIVTLRTDHENAHQVPDGTVQRQRLGLQDLDLKAFKAKGYTVVAEQIVERDELKPMVAEAWAQLLGNP